MSARARLTTTRFYAPPSAFTQGRVVLPADEARHAVKVLRAREGAVLTVVDGVGGHHEVILEQADVRQCVGRVVSVQQGVGEPAYALTLGVGLLKQMARFEWVLEKATELGVTRIVPLLTTRTERSKLKESRAQHILVGALKQSGRSRLVDLTEPMAFERCLAHSEAQARFICHEAEAVEAALGAQLAGLHAASYTILIGPEGGFTPNEVEEAVQAGFARASLGTRRLRTETAALAAASAVLLAHP